MSEQQEFSLEWSGGTVTGQDEASVRRCVADLEAQERKRDEMKQRFPGTNRQQMTALCRLFPTLADEANGIDPWNADTFALWAVSTGACSGALHAARFVLQVWNCSADWIAMLKREAERSKPDDKHDRPLWDGVQRLKAQARRDLEAEARDEARERQRPARPVTDAQVEERLFGYFECLHPFNVCAAFGTWDDRHREAFRTWTRFPFFP
jgi:hypothetical protein